MALPRNKRRRLATQAEKDRARQNGETVPTYVIVDTVTSGGSSSPDCSPTPSSSPDCGGGGSSDGGGF